MKSLMFAICVLFVVHAFAQQPVEKITFKEYNPGFYRDSILGDVNKHKQNESKSGTYPVADFSGQQFPTKVSDYNPQWHNTPVSQGNTGTCWCYSATSFFESEIYRISGLRVKLSEMYTVYWEYVERARDFVNTRGETYFEQGSEANAIPRMWKLYGIVPYKSYPGIEEGRRFHSHSEMIKQMKNYLKDVKRNNVWDENVVIDNIKSILNSYMGNPPEKIIHKEDSLTPIQYLENVLKLRLGDYFSFMSTSSVGFNETHELVEPDNWWHGKNYYNLSLKDYFELIIKTIESGYTASICGDVSEPGYDAMAEVGLIPTFDIPPEYINDNSRQFRLGNGSTTDDHCIHLVGYKKNEEDYWFLVKDSGSGGFDGPNKGYRFYHQDYIKLKMMNILIHKEPAREILDRIIK